MKRVALFVLVVGVAGGTPAVADVYIREVSTDPYVNMTIYTSGSPTGVYTPAGIYNLRMDLDGSPGGAYEDLRSFCIDVWDISPSAYVPYQTKPLDQTPDQQAGPMGIDRARYLATLFNQYWNDTYLVTGLPPSQMNQNAAALQVAAWEIVDEGNTGGEIPDPVPDNWNVRKDSGVRGNFYVSDNAVASIANEMLTYVRTTGGSAYSAYIGLSSHVATETSPLGKWQDYVIQVPVPGAVLLGVLGLGAAGMRLRRFAQ